MPNWKYCISYRFFQLCTSGQKLGTLVLITSPGYGSFRLLYLTNSSSSNCNMKLRRVAFGVAYLYLSLAVCVLGRSFTETSPDTAIAVEDHHALAESSRISWSFTPSSLGLQQLRVPIVRFRTLNPVSQERRSLRNVETSPDTSGGAGNTGGGAGGVQLSTAEIVIIVVSSVLFVLLVVVLVFWCRRKKNNDPEWRFLDSFKRKKPQTDQEKLYAQAKSDTHLSGY